MIVKETQENFLAKQMKVIMRALSKKASKDKTTKRQVSFLADSHSNSFVPTSAFDSNYFDCSMKIESILNTEIKNSFEICL